MSLHESMTVEDHAARVDGVLRGREASDAGPALSGVHLRPDGGTAALSGGQRLHLLHRVRRWPRLHAPDHQHDLRHPARTGRRQRAGPDASKARTATATCSSKPALDVFDDGPEKPVRIWNRIGRRPILAAGNSNGDDEMLMYSGRPGAAVAAAAGAARRRRARIRLHRRSGTRPRARQAVRLDRRQHEERLGDRLQ